MYWILISYISTLAAISLPSLQFGKYSSASHISMADDVIDMPLFWDEALCDDSPLFTLSIWVLHSSGLDTSHALRRSNGLFTCAHRPYQALCTDSQQNNLKQQTTHQALLFCTKFFITCGFTCLVPCTIILDTQVKDNYCNTTIALLLMRLKSLLSFFSFSRVWWWPLFPSNSDNNVGFQSQLLFLKLEAVDVLDFNLLRHFDGNVSKMWCIYFVFFFYTSKR